MQIQPASAVTSAAGGIVASECSLDLDAQHIAQDPFDVDSQVAAELAPVAVQANAAMFRAADQTSTFLVDTYA